MPGPAIELQPDKRLDVGGAVTATLALGALAWGLTQLEQELTYALPLLIAGAVLIVLFVQIEARTENPMLPLHLFANRDFSAANAATLLLYGGLSVVLLFLPMTVIAGWGLLEIEAAVAFAPLSIFISTMSTWSGRQADRFGARALVTTGAVLACLGYSVLGFTAPWMSYWGVTLPAMSVVGLGMGLVVAPLSALVMKSAPETLSGVASGVNNAVSRIAGLLGVALAGALAATLYQGPLSFAALGGDMDHIQATNAAFSGVAYLSAGLAALSAAIAWWGLGRR